MESNYLKRSILSDRLAIAFFLTLFVFFIIPSCVQIFGQSKSLQSVAVIRFENRSTLPENDWLGLGFAETISSKLGLIDGLAVIERTKVNEVLTRASKEDRLNESQTSVGESYARILGVEYLLIGSVQMTGSYKDAATPIKVSARIINTSTAEIKGDLVFSVRGNIGDLFTLESELAGKFCEALGVTSGIAALAYEDAQSLLAQQLYSEGMKAYYSNAYPKAIELFREAIHKNEGVFYAAAHTMEGYARQKQIARAQESEKEKFKEEYVTQFRKDASEAAPAFYDLGTAQQATGLYDEGIKAFGEYLRYMNKNNQLLLERSAVSDAIDRVSTVVPDSADKYDVFWPVFQKNFHYKISKNQNYETDGLLCLWNNGGVRWKIKLPDCGGESPTLSKIELFGDSLYIGAYVIAMINNRTGKEYWHFPDTPFLNDMGWPIAIEDIVFYQDKMYVVVNNTIYILNRSTGKKLAEYRGGSGIYVREGIFDLGTQCVNTDRLLEKKLYSEIDALYQIAKTYWFAQRVDSASKYAEDVLGAYPNHVGAIEIMAQCALASGQRNIAVDRIIQLYTLTPNHSLKSTAQKEFGILNIQTFQGWLENLKYEQGALWAVFGGEFNRGANVNELRRLDVTSGETIWKRKIEFNGQYTLSFEMDSANLYCAWPKESWNNNEAVWKYDIISLSKKTGQIVWKTPLNDRCQVDEGVYSSSIVPRLDGNFLYITFYNGNVYKIARSTGAVVWSRSAFGDGTIKWYDASQEHFSRAHLGIGKDLVYTSIAIPDEQKDSTVGFDKLTGRHRQVLPSDREQLITAPEDTTAFNLFTGYGQFGIFSGCVYTEDKIFAGSKDRGILILDRSVLRKLRDEEKIWWK